MQTTGPNMEELVDQHHGAYVAGLRVQVSDPGVLGDQPALQPFDARTEISTAPLSVAAGALLDHAFLVLAAQVADERER